MNFNRRAEEKIIDKKVKRCLGNWPPLKKAICVISSIFTHPFLMKGNFISPLQEFKEKILNHRCP